MIDVFTQDTVIVLLIAACAILIVLPIQLVLCFKAKKIFIKCLPTTLLAASTVAFYIMAITAKTWAALIYLIIAAFLGVSFIFSGIAWGIWASAKLIKKRTSK